MYPKFIIVTQPKETRGLLRIGTVINHKVSPAVNVLENEKDFQIELAAPGMTKGDFSVRLENNNELSIKLEKKSGDKKEQIVKTPTTRQIEIQ